MCAAAAVPKMLSWAEYGALYARPVLLPAFIVFGFCLIWTVVELRVLTDCTCCFFFFIFFNINYIIFFVFASTWALVRKSLCIYDAFIFEVTNKRFFVLCSRPTKPDREFSRILLPLLSVLHRAHRLCKFSMITEVYIEI